MMPPRRHRAPIAGRAGPAFGADLLLKGPADVEVGARSQFLGDEVARPIPHAFLDVVPSDDEILPIVAHAANDEVNMGMLGVPMIDGGPPSREPRSFSIWATSSRVGLFQIRHLQRVVSETMNRKWWRSSQRSAKSAASTVLGSAEQAGLLRHRG